MSPAGGRIDVVRHPLHGIDGANLVAFMGAIGVMRWLSVERPAVDAGLAWSFDGRWTPTLFAELDRGELVDALVRRARRTAALLQRYLPTDQDLTADRLRELGTSVVIADDEEASEVHAWIAALGSDGCPRPDGRGLAEVTPFKTLGGGRQRFLPTLIELAQTVEPRQIEHALFETWEHEDEAPTLRWDPRDDRRHAYRWQEPATDPLRTVAGINALAMAALPFFPTMPTRLGLRASGFSRVDGALVATWPIWTAPIGASAIGCLLMHDSLHRGVPDRRTLRSLGVSEVFRSARIPVDRYLNFTPSWNP
ncbi:MAG: hypothetical protein FJ257_06355 [Phycisphaerae bacterium]|nr:hypothetical protein [Phycisphaerae bacterium]